MKIFFFTPYPSLGASTRYRIEQFIPFLERNDVNCRVIPFMSERYYNIVYKKGNFLKKVIYFIFSSVRRIIQVFQCGQADVVFIHRQVYPFGGVFFEKIIKLVLKKPIIYDFDDAIFLSITTKNNKWIGFLKNNYYKVSNIIKLSDIVIVGNEYLKSFACKFNDSVIIIPTVVNIDQYEQKYHSNKEPKEVILGWIGSEGTTCYLELIRDVMLSLIDKYNIKFRLIGADSMQFQGINGIDVVRWSEESEYELLQSIDIGINPLPEDDFTLGKCGLKTIQYMAMGIPCVSSPVGVNTEIIEHGENGYLANGIKEWIEYCEMLIVNFELRKEMGYSARDAVISKYTTQVWEKEFFNIIKNIKNKV